MIWKRHLTLEALNATSDNTLIEHLAITYTRIGDDFLEAEMPVDSRTHQPFGLLHGGASAALAETLGSMAGFMMTSDGQCVVGTELNATHHRAVAHGKVRGVFKISFTNAIHRRTKGNNHILTPKHESKIRE